MFKIANSPSAFKQCSRCHMLTHNDDTCPKPPIYIRCGLCGRTDHTAASHAVKCGRKHASIRCDCPPTCFNCLKAKKPNAGHYATDDTCPLKKNMRRPDIRTSSLPPNRVGMAEPMAPQTVA